MEETLQCYNKGCGKQFKPEENTKESCSYHPGAPFFHDAYKGWSCCNKKSTDFTEFLNTKGCTKGEHSNVKPPEPAKVKVDKVQANEVITYTPPVAKPMERPSEDGPTKRLTSTVGSSLKTMLANLKPKSESSSATNDVDEIKCGTSCKNGGCRKEYKSADCNNTTCQYHPGVPIFHEGMKYWSCCQRKTSDFTNFLSQEGCESGTHLWIKTEAMVAKETTCRYDWHQTGSHVIISIYAKATNPDLSFVEANGVKVKVHLVFGPENNVFDLHVPLFGVINVDESKVNMLGSKVEINMRKSEPMSWGKLTVPVTKNESPSTDQ